MGRYLGPKCRLCRREKTKLYLKGERCLSPKCPIDRKGAATPGMHKYRMRKTSGYGIQLREKQKIRRSYLVMERQLKKYYEEARQKKGDTGEILMSFLERRLDNVVYRSGLVASRSQSRQLIDHGFIQVDGKRVSIPSYRLRQDQIVSLSPKGLNIKFVKEAMAKKKVTPKWLQRKVHAIKILYFPKRDDFESDFNDQLIVEFYSR